MKKIVNRTKIEGYIYEHTLELKKTGENSKNPGTEYIAGELKVATDEACLNVVPVHFSYVTATTAQNKANATFTTLKAIIDGTAGSVMANGKENASKVRIDSAIGLNEFYTDRNGKDELVSAKRNEGGFVHLENAFTSDDEKDRNTFECDMVITGCTRLETDGVNPEKMTVKGATFDFRGALLPVEFVVYNPKAMDYFESLEPTQKVPVFTKIAGRQISTTIVKQIVEESAFGEDSVKEQKNTRKDWVITFAAREPYAWDSKESITAKEMIDKIAERETYLATIKQRQDEYKASKGKVAPAAAAQTGGFKF